MSRWDDIRFFLAVARAASISEAAAELGVNYTTVMRRIQSLEAQIAVRLFERLPEGFVMTAAAEAVFEDAAAMEEQAHSFSRGLFGHDTKLSGKLRVATSDAVATELILPTLGRFRALHPAIDLAIASSDGVVSLDLREADVAVRMSGSPPEHLIGTKVAEVGYGVFASKKVRAAHKRVNNPSVQALTWIDEPAPAWRSEFSKTQDGLQFDSALAVRAAIRLGLGIGLLPNFLATGDKSLVRVNRRPVESGWSLWILSHPDTRTTARLRVFRSFLSKALKERADAIA